MPRLAQRDRFNRTWKNQPVGWITVINNARMAEYSWRRVGGGDRGRHRSGHNGRWKLVYDKKHGMYDYRGRHIKEPAFEKRAVLLKRDGTYEHFPSDEDSQEYKWGLEHGTVPTPMDVEDDEDVVPPTITIK